MHRLAEQLNSMLMCEVSERAYVVIVRGSMMAWRDTDPVLALLDVMPSYMVHHLAHRGWSSYNYSSVSSIDTDIVIVSISSLQYAAQRSHAIDSSVTSM